MAEETTTVSKKALWAGRILSGLLVLMLAFSAVVKLMRPAGVMEEFDRLQIPGRLAIAVGILELGCAIIYAIPQTAVLGAILLTGYLGGAILTHFRISDPFWSPLVLGVLVWLGLYLRDPRLRALIPWRK
jgi:uncharacterized membrane protein YphA (DoxX/SURF4 family)